MLSQAINIRRSEARAIGLAAALAAVVALAAALTTSFAAIKPASTDSERNQPSSEDVVSQMRRPEPAVPPLRGHAETPSIVLSGPLTVEQVIDHLVRFDEWGLAEKLDQNRDGLIDGISMSNAEFIERVKIELISLGLLDYGSRTMWNTQPVTTLSRARAVR